MRAKKVFIVTLLLIASLGMSSSQQAMASITYSFTTAGASGRTGPIQSQVTTAYTGTTLAGVVSVNTQGIQEWTVPFSGQYSILRWAPKVVEVTVEKVLEFMASSHLRKERS